MLPPMLQISNDDGSGGYHSPYSATVFFTSAFNRPGCATAVRVTGSTVMSRIFSVLSTMPPVSAVAPPHRPVPIPRGTTAILLAVAQRITVCTSSVRRGRPTHPARARWGAPRPPPARRRARPGVKGTSLPVGRQDVGVGDDDAIGQ